MNNPFAPQGDIVKWTPGQTVDFEVVEFRTEMGTKFQSSEPEEKHILLIKVDGVTPGKVYLKPGQVTAMGQAMAEAGHAGLPEPGAKVRMTYTGDELNPRSGRTFQAYTAIYQRPTAAAGVFAAAAAQPAPVAAPAPVAQPAPMPAAAPADAAAFFGQG